MIDEETAKKLVGLAGLGFGLTSGNRANYGMENAPASTYQGGIPEYDFVREQVLDTYDPDRVPGSRGQRYFSDARFVPAGSAGTANVRQELFNQANVGPDSLRAANYARMGKEAPDLADRGPTGIAAASVYLSSLITKNSRTQREVSEAAGITEVTIRNRYKELCKALSINPHDD